MKAKIIISGVTGFVGSNLKEYLEDEQYTVQGVSRKKNKSLITYQDLDYDFLNSSDIYTSCR